VQRTARDECYAPTDGAILLILIGGVTCLLLVGALLPQPFWASSTTACIGAYLGFGIWCFRGHRPQRLRRRPNQRERPRG